MQVRDAAKLAAVSPPEIKAAEAKNQQAAEHDATLTSTSTLAPTLALALSYLTPALILNLTLTLTP